MTVANFVYQYRGLLEELSRCRLRMYHLDSGMIVAVASELATNPGTSITTFAAQLATSIRRMYVPPGSALVWIEHHPGQPESFTQVLFRWDGEQHTSPRRRPISRARLEALIGEALDQEQP
jgi:hypothetical protein